MQSLQDHQLPPPINRSDLNLILITFPTTLAINCCQRSLSAHYHHSCHATADRDLHVINKALHFALHTNT